MGHDIAYENIIQYSILNKATACLPIAVFMQFKIGKNLGWEQTWMAGSSIFLAVYFARIFMYYMSCCDGEHCLILHTMSRTATSESQNYGNNGDTCD